MTLYLDLIILKLLFTRFDTVQSLHVIKITVITFDRG